jgi:hypothetical protein
MHLEQHIENYLVKRVEARGGKTKKIVAAGDNHWPDRLVADPVLGLFLVELKRPKGGRLSEGQKVRIGELRSMGIRVEVLWTKDQVELLFDDAEEI